MKLGNVINFFSFKIFKLVWHMNSFQAQVGTFLQNSILMIFSCTSALGERYPCKVYLQIFELKIRIWCDDRQAVCVR